MSKSSTFGQTYLKFVVAMVIASTPYPPLYVRGLNPTACCMLHSTEMSKASQRLSPGCFYNCPFFLSLDKPPEDPWQRRRYFKEKQKYVRYHRFYGNSLVGGIDQAKIITVMETGAKKKKEKDKQGKMVR